MHIKPRTIIIVIFSLGVLSLLLVGGYFAKRIINSTRAPLYTLTQSPSALADFMSTTLASGDNVYVSDVPEYALMVDSSFLPAIVGRTADGLVLYAIPGQKPGDYVALSGLMFPSEPFRNTSTPPFDWRKAEFQEIRLMPGEAGDRPKQSDDPQLIAEALAAMQGSFGPALTLKVPAGSDLRLVSDQLPGLVYCARVYFDDAGQIYLAENGLSDQWFPAGPLFTTWAKTNG